MRSVGVSCIGGECDLLILSQREREAIWPLTETERNTSDWASSRAYDLAKMEVVEVMSTKRFGIETMVVHNYDLLPLDTLHDVQRWLNYSVINFYLALVAERENAGGKMRVLVHSTDFWRALTEPQYDYEKVRQWSQRKGVSGSEILDLDYIIIPIDQANLRWSLGVINIKEKRFEYHDPYPEDPGRRDLFISVGPPVFMLNPPSWLLLISNSI
jgi:Ulp1 family protease